jgi:hypothetical protein
MLRLAMTALSRRIRRKARRLGVSYEFLFMRASGDQLAKIAALVDAARTDPSSDGSCRSTRPPKRWQP